ncbi:MAG: thrombospondin type 3 repeat-containing protein [Bradymonadales bacterium]|nr:thrombospondin type 3 repeat-containing protein [Bradymonadales bacterium]
MKTSTNPFRIHFPGLVLMLTVAIAPACGDDEVRPPDQELDLGEEDAREDLIEDLLEDIPDELRPDLPGDLAPDTADLQPDIPIDLVPDTADLQPDAPADLQPEVIDLADAGDADTGPVEVIECALLTPPATGTCEVTAGDGKLLIRSTILSDDIYVGGEILLSAAGDIACVGCDCATDAPGATVLTCAEAVVSPGLINTHDHLTYTQNFPIDPGEERFEHRHDWRLGMRYHSEADRPVRGGASNNQQIWGEMRQVLGGTTSLSGAGAVDGFLRNLDRSTYLEGLDVDSVYLATFPLGSTGLRAADCDYSTRPNTSVLEASSYSPHVSEGIDQVTRNEYLCLSRSDRDGIDVTGPNGAYIHMIPLLAVDAADLAYRGTAVVWSPRTNIALYGHTAPVTLLERMGVTLALGTDWTPTGSINMLRELQCADLLNSTYYDSYFSDQRLWEMATVDAARAMGVANATGALRPGLAGDIAIFADQGADNPYRVVIEATVGDVVLVLRGGLPLYGDTAFFAQLPGGDTGCESIPGGVCEVAKTICTQRETGKTFAELQAANNTAYDLFFCGPPPDEPSCIPFRQGEFTGQVTETDSDADGIPNDQDNCPTIHNPLRPVDGWVQADYDRDGVGDVCDPCPLDANTTSCSLYHPTDQDHDGYTNTNDNCPLDYNPEQADSDGDGLGDECDLCPLQSNEENPLCLVSIYQIKDGSIPLASRVLASGIVTGVSSPQFYIQLPESLWDETYGAQYSGVLVYIPSTNPQSVTVPTVGDLVTVEGEVTVYDDPVELDQVSRVTVQGSGWPVPSPVAVTLAEVATDGLLTIPLEGALVDVEGIVTQEMNQYGEFLLDELLLVDDWIYETTPAPLEGDQLEITGILRFANDDSKVVPRDSADVVLLGQAPPRLVSVEPSLTYLELGEIDAVTHPPLVVTFDRPIPEGGITLSLESDDPAVVAVPAELPVPEYVTEFTLVATGVSAADEPVSIEVGLGDQTLLADIRVVAADRLPKVESIEPVELELLVESSTILWVWLDTPVGADGLTVFLASTPGTGLSFAQPDPLIEWEMGVAVEVTGTSLGTETLTASANGGEASAVIDITDVPPIGLVISEVLYDVESNDPGREWVELYNGSGVTLDLSEYSLGTGGSDYTYRRVQLTGTLDAGGCFVIGGTTSDELNYNPVFDQEYNWNDGIQNAGSASDGVALFRLPATEITGATIPQDAVIYDSPNSNNLPDENGIPGVPDVGDAPAGSSIERTPEGWRIQSAPTPNDCSALQ